MPTSGTVVQTAADVLENARALDTVLRSRADEIARSRRLPEDVVAALAEAGMFRMAMPAAWGGPETDPLTQIEVIETLSIADASAGWCAMILSDGGFYASHLDEATARELYPRLDMGTAGQLAPVGRAEKVPGGYRVSGKWSFGSGSLHADRIVGGCLVTENGDIVEGEGIPWRVAYLPLDEVEILDTWYTTGLAGTGSNDYTATDVFVPEAHTFYPLEPGARPEPLYAYHGFFYTNLMGAPLGMARRAVDELVILAQTKTSLPALAPLRDEYRVQVAVAEAEATLRAARAFAFDVVGDVWATLTDGREPTSEERAAVGMAVVHTAQAARSVVEQMCEAAGSSAIYTDSPLERVRRDILTASGHLVAQAKSYQMPGQVLLGIPLGLTWF